MNEPQLIDVSLAEEIVQAFGHETVADYQAWHGLTPDGIFGPLTRRHVLQPRCGLPDTFAIEEARWPDECLAVPIRIDYTGFRSNQMGLTRSQFEQLYVAACEAWNAVLGTRLHLAEDGPATDISFRRLAGTTLAWSYLADNTCHPKAQAYDIRQWPEKILFLTILHELGHLIGLGHIPGRYVMNPSIVVELDGLTDQDISAALALGYPGAGGVDVMTWIDGKRYTVTPA